MKRFAIVAAILFIATSSAAQDPGDFGIFTDSAGTQTFELPPPFTPSTAYVFGFDLAGDIAGYEFGLSWDPNLIVMGYQHYPVGSITLGYEPQNFLVGVPGCYSGAGPVLLAQVQFLNLGPIPDMLVCLRPPSPSSFFPPAIGWTDCAFNLHQATLAQRGAPHYPDGCLVYNPTGFPPIGVETKSWGSLKAQY